MNFGHFHHPHHHHHTRTVVHHHHDHHSHHNAGGGLLLGGLLLGAVAGAAIANNNNNSSHSAQVVYSPPAQTVHPQQFAMHQAQARQHNVQVMGAPHTVQPVYNASVAPSMPAPAVAIANCVACQAPIQFTRTGAAAQVRCYNCPTVNTFY
jgi:hypothetical protein